ncbi:MAG: hypothetical protein GX797_02495 [Chloroflexi bacterium]|nr:hypothetical protein [Chloroflexota bacterium]
MNITNQLFMLSTKSLWLLLAEYAPITVIGIENPYQGWLVEDIEADAQKRIESLQESGLLIANEDDSYELVPELRAAVDLITSPGKILITLDSSSGTPQEQVYHYLGEHDSVSLTRNGKGLQLSHQADRESLLNAVLEGLPLPEQPQSSVEFSLLEESLYKITALAIEGNYADAYNAIYATPLNDTARQEFFEALQDRQANASFAILEQPNEVENQRVRGFGILAGGDRMWTLTPSNTHGQTFIQFTPINAEKLRIDLASIL